MPTLRAACIQMRSGIDVQTNIKTACALIEEAANSAAHMVCTPETTSLVDIRPGMARKKVFLQDADPALAAFCALARARRIWLLIGSLAVALEDDARLANRAFLISPEGKLVAHYDKIHMFDVDVDDGQSYRESKSYRPGTQSVLAKTPLGAIGLTICYDLRFPYLYRALAQAGAQIITAPSAFTKVTGTAHWHTLLRARAIETGAFLLAPAQGGQHEDGRQTFGHSLIVSPWGEVLAELEGDEPGMIMADLDLAEVAKARARIPSLTTDTATHMTCIDHD